MRTRLTYAILGAAVAIVCMLLYQHFLTPPPHETPPRESAGMQLLAELRDDIENYRKTQGRQTTDYFDGIQWEQRKDRSRVDGI